MKYTLYKTFTRIEDLVFFVNFTSDGKFFFFSKDPYTINDPKEAGYELFDLDFCSDKVFHGWKMKDLKFETAKFTCEL